MLSVVNDVEYPGDETSIEDVNQKIELSENEEPAWFWLKKGSRFYDQVKIGDFVVIIERDSSNAETPENVYRHFSIKYISQEPNNIKAYHYAYNKEHCHDWDSFLEMANQAGIKNLGSGLNTARELSEKQSNILFELCA